MDVLVANCNTLAGSQQRGAVAVWRTPGLEVDCRILFGVNCPLVEIRRELPAETIVGFVYRASWMAYPPSHRLEPKTLSANRIRTPLAKVLLDLVEGRTTATGIPLTPFLAAVVAGMRGSPS